MPKFSATVYPIYLDNAAATPMDERVIQAMLSCLNASGTFGNSASKDHIFGWEAAEVVEKARDQIASSIGASPLELIFTSGATESNNLAIRGLAYGLKRIGDPRRHIITTTIEHKAVLENCDALAADNFSNFRVTYLSPRRDGTISPQMLEAAMEPDTFLVSISHANSVLGSMNDIAALSDVAAKYGAYFHSDCAQSNGISPLDLNTLNQNVSMVTLTPEKIYGPKGIGALYLKRSLELVRKISPLILGGGHEKNLRGGTLATHQIAAMGEAFEIMTKEREQVRDHINSLRARLIDGLNTIDGVVINGYMESPYTPALESQTPHLPGVVSVSFPKLQDYGQYLIPSLRGLACSSGSACSSKELKPSYVLTALGVDESSARASLRLSLGRYNTTEDVDKALEIIKQTLKQLGA